MQCPRCQHENPQGQKFCGQCGAPLAATCASCRASNPPEQKFCGGCGASLSREPAARSGSPDAYTPKHLAEKILTSKAALEGERKQVTVLFADMKGSMELLADRDPEEARKILDPVLERMMEAVHRYEGTVNQVMGDGIMALFGAPLAHEDHAVRACYAALRMQRRINLYADEIQREGGTPVQVRVGLNSGEVVVRSIGNDLHMDYTAVGQTTHLAARMEQIAKPGSVLVTGETLNLAEGFVQVRPLGAVTVKGLEAAPQVYELIGIGPARSRLQASAVRGLTRFVGRDSELQQLAQAIERAGAGHGQAVAVVGEAGVGKSRLAWEFTRSHRTHGWLVLESGSVSYGKATPYLPVIELLKAYCRIQERDDQREIRERVAGKLLMLDRALEPLLTPLLALLDVPVDDATWDALDPPQRRQRTLDAVKRLLLRESQVQPLLVLFEDLHWIDSETQALLDSLMESLPTARVLLLVNYRPEYQHAWGHKTYYLQLRMDPLPPKTAEELLNALLGEDRALEPLKRLLIGRTEGNPFFLEESVRTLVETQMLIGERGTYRLAKALEPLQIPATAQAILATRIDRLPPEDKRLLQTASVIGKDVPFTLLQAIADEPDADLHGHLAHLQAAEFLYETALFPDPEYTFKHALTYEVAYGNVLQERRRLLHARIVEVIERLYRDRLPEHVERLAHHASRGEVWEKAVTYLRQAGAKAFARSANREAVSYFEQALAALRHLPETRATLEQDVDLRFHLRTTLLALGEVRRVLELLREAESIATALDDQRRLARICIFAANCHFLLGDPDRAFEFGKRALATGVALEDRRLQIEASVFLGQTVYQIGDVRRGIQLLTQSLASLEEQGVSERIGMAGLPIVCRSWLLWCLADIGEFAEAMPLAEEAMRFAGAGDRPGGRIVAGFGVAYFYLRKGDFEKTIAVNEPGIALCRGGNFPLLFPIVAMQLGYAYALSGRVDEAIPLLEEAVGQAAAQGVMAVHSLHHSFLGEAYRLAGRMGEANRAAERALELARAHKEPRNEVQALWLLGKILSRGEAIERDRAEAFYRQALGIAERLDLRPWVADCRLDLGLLHRRRDAVGEARKEIGTALALYREMGMDSWERRAHVALAKLETT